MFKPFVCLSDTSIDDLLQAHFYRTIRLPKEWYLSLFLRIKLRRKEGTCLLRRVFVGNERVLGSDTTKALRIDIR